ncbi:KilA-N domain-containing protein [Sphingobacterium kyonggiense]
MLKLTVQDKDISLLQVGDEVFVSLTDIVKNEEGDDHIRNWMRNRNTLEFLGLWEQINNPGFKGVEFDTFRKEAGLNSFNMTPRKWIDSTNAKGIISKAGRIGGGTFAHKDIALEFCTWLSPMFKLLVLKEFQRLKELNELQGKWDLRRYLSKVNYKIQTDVIKDTLIPISKIPKDKEGIIYANEADIIYVAMYGYTSKQWRDNNPELCKGGLNIRDYANTHELIVLSNLES